MKSRRREAGAFRKDGERPQKAASMFVRDVMTANPITVTPDVSVMEALEIMKRSKVRRLPVVQGGKLVGIVTDRDLLQVSPSPATSLSVFEINLPHL